MQPSQTIARGPGESRLLTAAIGLFAVTMFVGSGLLFLVQPMFARLILPRLGGSPSVWNTCMLFFQTTLLLGYVYGHVTTKWLGVRRQAVWHIVVVLVPLIFLPLTAGPPESAAADRPVAWLLQTMTFRIGVPFFVVSTSAPLLQRWLAEFPIASARDPYFLYSASNLGSMIALLGYPLLLEPSLGVRGQTILWTAGYVTFVFLTSACIWCVRTFAAEQSTIIEETVLDDRRLSARTRVEWVVLSWVPSSMLLGVTTYISTDIAPVPLLWVVPLALYLLTFVLAFSPRQVVPYRSLVILVRPLIVGSLLTVLLNGWWFMPLHLLTFFCASMVCHRGLADRRPHVSHLTEFYIWISVGGMLGGVFNTLIAPQLFATILEYPLVLAIASLVTPAPVWKNRRPESTALLIGALSIVLGCFAVWISGVTSEEIGRVVLAAAIGLSIPLIFAGRIAPFRVISFALVGLIALASLGRTPLGGTVLFVGRSFFGVHRVIEAADRTSRTLYHGSTMHGWQQLPAETSCEPSSYYFPAGPIGQVFAALGGSLRRVAVVGLGTGALSCYAETGQRWTFYEIDPIVEEIARNPAYFTQLRNSRAELEVVLGDGRITLNESAPKMYDLLILDAFSSDAIPIHLLTREAFDLYFSRLDPAGIVAVHISNRYLNLEPVLGAMATHEGIFALANQDFRIPAEDIKRGRRGAHWVVVAKERSKLAAFAAQPGWRPLKTIPDVEPWSDDFSNILRVFRFR